MKGFSLIELIIVVAILLILAGIGVAGFRVFEKISDLGNDTEEIISVLRMAQNKTLSSESASQWGVYFNASSSPNKYILFKGASYADRDPASDESHDILGRVEIESININGGSSEIVFNRLSGAANLNGNIVLRLKDDLTKIKTVYIESSGQISLTAPSLASDSSRIKDSRHAHFKYGRIIDTATEKIVLTFNYDASPTTQEIIIANNLKGSQIYWEGAVSVEGQSEQIKIQTHFLNDPTNGTQFSITRDRRYNVKSLSVDINGESSDPDPGTLITYTADGTAALGISVFVSEMQLQ
ncbi:MAG: prepilin-type N-terminal cleavage/methylation domain-containing protein [Candidatus Parcubacteria bacterium]|nr:prepilin-type N-terminal cleavage/methylation domain-containing protein [Candidatus Parcubacteria bacterium]